MKTIWVQMLAGNCPKLGPQASRVTYYGAGSPDFSWVFLGFSMVPVRELGPGSSGSTGSQIPGSALKAVWQGTWQP